MATSVLFLLTSTNRPILPVIARKKICAENFKLKLTLCHAELAEVSKYNMNYEIREMLPEDGAAVLRIFEEGIAGGNATFDKTAPTWEDWDANHFKDCRFVAIDENGEIAGWSALKPVSNRNCFSGVAEVSIYLTNSAQGKGLGKVMLQKLILDSEEHGFWMLQSGIFPENLASIKLHERLGFRTVGHREKIAQMNGVWRDIILMERRSNTQ
jgi:phosphinothricin acetyltransferase